MDTPDLEHTAAFLASIGDGLHLCSIVPDGACHCRWFGDDVVAAMAWAKSENEQGKNIYWTVNRVSDGYHRKPSKEDIVAARFAHIDIDPPKDCASLDKLKVHAELCALPNPPSIIIDSGNGLQAFWRLVGPADLVEVEQLNRNIAARFHADKCHNIDRIMRVPGTLNYPNAKKRAAGRSIALAKVIYDADGVLA